MLHIRSFVFSPFQENTYIIYNDNLEALIVDPGCYFPEEEEALQRYIDEAQLRPVQLLNTHCHLDHVFGNRFVAEKWGLELYMHEKEEPVLAFAPTSGLMYNVPFTLYAGVKHYLKAGDWVSLGDESLLVLEAPGHSPGSICFYHEKQGFLIGGDVLFQRSIGRTDLPGGDHATLLNSIRTQLWPLPDATVVLSGHGNPTTIGEEKQFNPYLA